MANYCTCIIERIETATIPHVERFYGKHVSKYATKLTMFDMAYSVETLTIPDARPANPGDLMIPYPDLARLFNNETLCGGSITCEKFFIHHFEDFDYVTFLNPDLSRIIEDDEPLVEDIHKHEFFQNLVKEIKKQRDIALLQFSALT
jgi:hypothetical protein